MIYDSGSVPEHSIFSPRETSPESINDYVVSRSEFLIVPSCPHYPHQVAAAAELSSSDPGETCRVGAEPPAYEKCEAVPRRARI